MFDYDPYAELQKLKPVDAFTVTSAEITHDRPLAEAQWGRGGSVSPSLSWTGFPAATRSFAVTCFDPDAPTGSGYWHWAVLDIPASVTALPAGAGSPGSGALPPEAVTLRNEAGEPAFIGAGPPPGTGVHRYFFVVHAVDVETLDLSPEATPAVLGFTLHFHTLARAIIVPTAAGD